MGMVLLDPPVKDTDHIGPTTTTTPAAPRGKASCPHDQFEATVGVNRAPFTASVQVRCAACKWPMRFAADGQTTATLELLE